MSIAAGNGVERPQFFFDRAKLREVALAHRTRYHAARPYPHAVLDGFLGRSLATALAARFPGPEHPKWLRRDYAEQSGRMGQLQRSNFEGVDCALRHLLAELCGMAFLDFLSTLTGRSGFIPDPHFTGAGPSITLRGGHLVLHSDFNRDRSRHLDRALTVLYYLSPDWDEAWGGNLELWNEDLSRCEATYPPVLDRLVVMDHGDAFWHGHPEPLACPKGRYRASVSSYYYVASPSPSADAEAHGAIWAPTRP